MSTVAVVYHSGYGHTAKLANAVAGTRVHQVSVDQIDQHWNELATADAIIFGSPTYMGSVSAPFKAFMDASSKVWMQQGWKDKLAAGFTNSGSASGDKLNTLVQLAVFAAQHGMIWVSAGMMPGSNTTKSSPNEPNRLGSYLGVMAQSLVDAGPDIAPPPVDLETARALGTRVADLARQYQAGRQAQAA